MNEKTTIYYVDDDPDDLAVFEEAIASFGHNPALFTDGYQMLANMEDSNPENDLVFVDLNMPAVSGYDLIKAIRNSEKFSHVPIISYSTARDQHSVTLAKEAGANMHVPKSSSFDGLKRSLGYVLGIDWKNYKPDDKDFMYSEI